MRAIRKRFILSDTIDEIAGDLDMSKRMVEKVIHLWRTMGEVMPKSGESKRKSKRILTEKEVEVSFSFFEGWHSTYLCLPPSS